MTTILYIYSILVKISQGYGKFGTLILIQSVISYDKIYIPDLSAYCIYIGNYGISESWHSKVGRQTFVWVSQGPSQSC